MRAATLRAVRRCRRTLERRFDKFRQVFARQAVSVMLAQILSLPLPAKLSAHSSQPSDQIDETTIVSIDSIANKRPETDTESV